MHPKVWGGSGRRLILCQHPDSCAQFRPLSPYTGAQDLGTATLFLLLKWWVTTLALGGIGWMNNDKADSVSLESQVDSRVALASVITVLSVTEKHQVRSARA